MTDNDLKNGPVELGAPVLTVNPPAKPKEKAEQDKQPPATDRQDDAASHQDDG